MLAVVTCRFNPANFSNPTANYWRFREDLSAPVTTVELIYDQQEPQISDAIHIKGTMSENCIWQKEALLNIAIKSLPADVDKVAWIDADIISGDPNWLHSTSEMLETYPMLQMFSKVHVQQTDGSIQKWPAVMAASDEQAQRAKIGYAWAARREILENGLYDSCLCGAGDVAILHAAAGRFASPWARSHNDNTRRHWLAWASSFYQKVKGKIGCLPCTVTHLYHGNSANRQYHELGVWLNSAGFDPNKHIRLGSNGLIEWTPDTPEIIKQKMKDYFEARQEDQ